jgi:hypothetical protein
MRSIIGNRALGHFIYEVVRGLKRRYSFGAMLLVFGMGIGLLVIPSDNSLFAG